MKDSGRDQLDWGPEVQKSLPKGVPTESSTVALDPGVLSANLQARAGQDVQCRGNLGVQWKVMRFLLFQNPFFREWLGAGTTGEVGGHFGGGT